MRTTDVRIALVARLLAIAGGATLAGCGSGGSSDVDQTGTSGSSGTGGAAGSAAGSAGGGGASGAGGSSGAAGTGASSGAAGAGGGGGAAAAGSAGSAGVGAGGAGAAGAAGKAGAGGAGVGGSSGSGGASICDPKTGKGDTGAPLLYCQSTGPVGPPPGCSPLPDTGGPISCYLPGASGSPPDTCLPGNDPSLLQLLSRGCGGIAMSVTSEATCEKAADMGGTPALACCYKVTFTATCAARPFFMQGAMRTADGVERSDWV